MPKIARLINEKDNVVTVLEEVKAGEEVKVVFKGKEKVYVAKENIPYAHKLAIKDIEKGEPVVKYGYKIGVASKNISVGSWVHTHNVLDDYVCLGKDGKPLPGQE